MQKLTLVVWSVLASNVVTASPRELFTDHFHEQYEARQCGRNTNRFLTALGQEGEDLQEWTLVFVENVGFSTFGMVNAERARDASSYGPIESEKNWYHHAFALDADGVVYDFDYTLSPTPLKFRTYIENMFLDEDECGKEKQNWMAIG